MSYLNLYSDRCTVQCLSGVWVKVEDGSYIKYGIRLINVFIIKFNIGFSLHLYLINNKLIIYTPGQTMTKNNLISIGKPHIIPSMYYKLVENVNAYYNFKPNSNTINKLTTKKSFSNTSINKSLSDNKIFNEWLSGLIDGGGHFNLTKKGIARLIIIMDIRDKKALFDIKHKFAGSIRTIARANALKYQISHKKGLIALLEAVKGLIRNPSRLLQMNKLCVKYRIELLYPKPLTFNNGWLSGFIDSRGLVYFNESNRQVFIEIRQKNKYLLDPLVDLYGGRIEIHSPKIEAFKYVIYRKNELFNLIDNYFTKYPLRTKKLNRIKLIKELYLKIISKNNKDIIKLNEWVKFKDTWDKKNFSTLSRRPIKSGKLMEPRGKLNPNYITGFTDGEGSFIVSIRRTSRLNIGYSVELSFRIKQHLTNKNLLVRIKNYFKIGVIGEGSNYISYTVSSIKELQIIINHFDSYPLITHKWSDYQLFKQVFNIVRDKQHLTNQGLKKIISLKNKLNRGLPDELKCVFSDLIIHLADERPVVTNNKIKDPRYIDLQVLWTLKGVFL